MREITKKSFIKDQNYITQLVGYSIFFISALAVLVVELILFSGLNFNSIFQLSFVVLVIVIPFGYFLGLRKMLKIIKEIRCVQKGHITIKEKQVVDKIQMMPESSDRYSQIVFSANDGVWLSEKKYNDFMIGDICYVFYIGDSEDPSAVYCKAKYSLSDDFKNE